MNNLEDRINLITLLLVRLHAKIGNDPRFDEIVDSLLADESEIVSLEVESRFYQRILPPSSNKQADELANLAWAMD
jgi:hypothetical protein